MVSPGYMLEKPPPPSPMKVFVDQVALPRLIDAAAALESRVERVAVCTRRSPLAGLAAAFGVGWLLVEAAAPRRRA